jgi:tRNA dimethylallyltransferase
MKSSLIVICGCTASGKSGLALELGQRLDSVVISADSRQVYREFDIGTAKPNLAEQNLVPHYLVDIRAPTETLTLAEYQESAQIIVNNYLKSSVSPLLVGGTGLYVKSITKGLKIPRVAPQPELRSQLNKLGQKQLYQMLTQIDAIASKKIHANDETRTLRALEVYYVTGKPISQQQGENPPNYPILHIGLDGETEILDQRIRQRTHKMVEMGLIEEVDYLINKYGADLPLLNTLGYAEFKQHLNGDISLSQAIDLTALHTRQFAKRQRTWFRAYPEIKWFNLNSKNLLEEVWEYVRHL